jgi:hypothetical protein
LWWYALCKGKASPSLLCACHESQDLLNNASTNKVLAPPYLVPVHTDSPVQHCLRVLFFVFLESPIAFQGTNRLVGHDPRALFPPKAPPDVHTYVGLIRGDDGCGASPDGAPACLAPSGTVPKRKPNDNRARPDSEPATAHIRDTHAHGCVRTHHGPGQ